MGIIMAGLMDECSAFQRYSLRVVSQVRAFFDGIFRNNWGAVLNYAVLTTFNAKYMGKVIKYYGKARTRMIKKLKEPNGHLVINKIGFSSTCCKDMYDAIVFREVDLNYDYENMFSSIRVDSVEKGNIPETDHCPYCGAKIEGIKVTINE